MCNIDISSKKCKKQAKKILNSIIVSKNNKENYRFHNLKINPTFNIDLNVFNHIKILKDMIMKNEIINNNFTEAFIYENILNLIEEIYKECNFNNSKNKANELIIGLENKINCIIKKEYDSYDCYFHIDNLKLDNELVIGNVLFFTVEEINDKLQTINTKLGKFFNVGETYALTTITGIKSHAFKKSKNNIRIAINMIKLFLPPSYCNFNIDGYTINSINLPYILYSDSNKMIGNKIIGPINENINPQEKINANKWGFDIVSKIMKNQNKTNFEERLITSIYWISEAKTKLNEISNSISDGNDNENSVANLEFYDSYPILLNITIALETLLIFDRESIDTNIAKKLTNLITKEEYKEYIEKYLINAYVNRSNIVHEGNVFISNFDLEMLLHMSLSVIYTLIEYNYMYHNEFMIYSKNSPIL